MTRLTTPRSGALELPNPQKCEPLDIQVCISVGLPFQRRAGFAGPS
jgi:hypothetical protein